MKDVTYALIGSGRLARHLVHYFNLSGVPVLSWSRNNDPQFNTHFEIDDHRKRLVRTLRSAGHVLLLISDDAIAPFIAEHPELSGKTLIHCSGALDLKDVHSVHPLMSFSKKLYNLEDYEGIHFVCDTRSSFQKLFPQLKNKHYNLSPEQRELYHSLCVISGNFPQFLWTECLDIMRDKLQLPNDILDAYIRRISDNFIELKGDCLTGPFVRRDQKTMNKNLLALKDSPLEDIYRSFRQSFSTPQEAL